MIETGQPLGDGSITEEKIRQLLALGGELDDLDYKSYLDLGKTKDKIELVKDFAAFQSQPSGGYILVGVDDSGVPTSAHGQLEVKNFDPANLTQIAFPYLPTIHLKAAIHDIDGATIVIIYVGPPDPPGLAIFVKDGQYNDGMKNRTAFRIGDVFVRRGTRSVRWQPSDTQSVLKPWEDHIREDERRRAAEYAQSLSDGVRARNVAQGPLGSLTWRLSADDFEASLLEAIRAGDTIAMRALVLKIKADASTLLESPDAQELDLLLDRLTASLALTVAYEQREQFNELLGVLVDLYSRAIDHNGNPRQADDHRFAACLWSIALAIEGTGGLAVRLKALWAIRPLAMPDDSLSRTIHEPSWIRHAVTAAAGANLLYTASTSRPAESVVIGGPVVAVARQLVERVPALRPDTHVSRFELNAAPEADDRVLNSLIQFDALWCVMAVARTEHGWDQYPSIYAFYGWRAAPAFELLITDLAARTLILGEDADRLKDAIKVVVERAQSLSVNELLRTWHLDSTIVDEYFTADEPTNWR